MLVGTKDGHFWLLLPMYQKKLTAVSAAWQLSMANVVDTHFSRNSFGLFKSQPLFWCQTSKLFYLIIPGIHTAVPSLNKEVASWLLCLQGTNPHHRAAILNLLLPISNTLLEMKVLLALMLHLRPNFQLLKSQPAHPMKGQFLQNLLQPLSLLQVEQSKIAKRETCFSCWIVVGMKKVPTINIFFQPSSLRQPAKSND